jgi:preprotein translocase subunit SecE
MLKKLIEYTQQSQKELKKVVWPTRKDVIRHTVLVVILSVGTAIFLGGVDYVVTLLLGTFFS